MFKFIGVLILVASVVGGWISLDIRALQNDALPIKEQGRSFIVEPGETLTRVANRLAADGLIDKPRYLVWWGRWHGHAQGIKAGEYALTPGMTATQLLEHMARGQVIQHSLTVVEGWSFGQMLNALEKHPKIKRTLANLSDAEIMTALGHPGEHPEGRFLPETYLFSANTTDVVILQRAYDAMQEILENEWAQRDPEVLLQSPYEALILASIVEKETGVASERPQIAGVFMRRLKIGMRLQTDPTIIYGMGEEYDGNIRRDDLQRDNPYNTYTRSGLPPTPIALPGRDAIHAALHPAAGDSLYFVARGDGSHEFTATLSQHNAAVRRYILEQ